MTVLIAGGGIAGLSMALTCHQLGLAATVFEAAAEIKPLGVGINLQPNAVRELIELGLADQLDSIGVQAKEWALFATGGKLVWAEPRGLAAGYQWPQYSVHRGKLQAMLLSEVKRRLGATAIVTDAQLQHYQCTGQQVTASFERADGSTFEHSGAVLVGADGIHSRVRAQMHPQQGETHWGGAVMWRGISRGVPCRTSNSFVLVGSMGQRFVCYPISKPDSQTGLADINWIAELTFAEHESMNQSDWNKAATTDAFADQFKDWRFGWLDVPALVEGNQGVHEYPMVDRDPVATWVDQRAVLVGDAAHVMYPVGSNGASQAIVDTRVLGANLQLLGLTPAALHAYQEALLEPINALVLRNRGAGPIGILGLIDDRSNGEFDAVSDIISDTEVEHYMQKYKRAAGFAVEQLNNSAPTITARTQH